MIVVSLNIDDDRSLGSIAFIRGHAPQGLADEGM